MPGFGGAAANAITRPSPKQALAAASGPSAGPFGYTEKGTFFIDSHYNGFPESIDLVYQGFVWAFTMNYPDQPSVLHGGVHTILLDKVLHWQMTLQSIINIILLDTMPIMLMITGEEGDDPPGWRLHRPGDRQSVAVQHQQADPLYQAR